MRIVHRISLSSSIQIKRQLANFGVDAPSNGFFTFEIDESAERWADVQSWISANRFPDFIRTEFSSSEVASSEWAALLPSWHWSYPQPDEGNFGYLEETYDLANYCPFCGSGLLQKAPFKMKSEPEWGGRSILQLNWIFDEFFATPEYWKNELEHFGIKCMGVLDSSGSDLRTVVQLVIPEIVDVSTKDISFESCPSCGRKKYSPMVRGYFPALIQSPTGHAAKTNQYFGSGGSANRRIIVSGELYSRIKSSGGVTAHPVNSSMSKKQTVN